MFCLRDFFGGSEVVEVGVLISLLNSAFTGNRFVLEAGIVVIKYEVQ